jgi:hypothetical protein
VGGEYGGNITYSNMKMENETCRNYSRNEGRGIKNSDGHLKI